jgi:hypothetical protein
MTWFLLTNWAFIAAIPYAILNGRRLLGEQMVWTGLLCLLGPLLLLFFLLGTALWLVSSGFPCRQAVSQLSVGCP